MTEKLIFAKYGVAHVVWHSPSIEPVVSPEKYIEVEPTHTQHNKQCNIFKNNRRDYVISQEQNYEKSGTYKVEHLKIKVQTASRKRMLTITQDSAHILV